MFLISSAAIALFYGAGLMWGRQTNLAIAEYWRWWVVHLWVEGFFEVFATVVIAFLFVRMGLIRANIANATVLFIPSFSCSAGLSVLSITCILQERLPLFWPWGLLLVRWKWFRWY